jgi:hypothetical protein
MLYITILSHVCLRILCMCFAQSLKREAEDTEVRLVRKSAAADDVPCPGEAWKK